jgi:phosphate starvation-inducible protein PhoH
MIALHLMLKELLSKSPELEKLVIVRSSVQARDVGFLPGALDGPESKNAVYEIVYKNMFNDLFKYKSNNYDNMKATMQLEFHNTSFLRGMTFDNTLVLVDEFQSMNYHELSTVITRLGVNSRIVFCGDGKQCDLHKRGDVSGLDKFMSVLENMQGEVAFVDFTVKDVVRSGVVKSFLLAEHHTL